MRNPAKLELILEGLNCLACALAMEPKLQGIKGVNSAQIDLMAGKLIIEADGSQDFAGITQQATDVITRMEPHVRVIHRETELYTGKYILKGVSCGNCLEKILKELRDMEGIIEVSGDFISGKLSITGMYKSSEMLTKVKAVIAKVEPHVQVLTDAQQPTRESSISHNTKELIRLGVGGAIFALGLILALPDHMRLMVFLLSYIIVGGEVVLKALGNIVRGQVFDENFLMTIATVGAFIIGEYPEGVAVMLFYSVGEYFQGAAIARSRKSISALMDIRPDFANLQVGEEFRQVSPQEVRVGDLILVRPGEKIPLDGRITEGYSLLDTSALTGESIPREVSPGDEILSGSINIHGVLTIQVGKEFGESTVSKILDLVQNASSRKSPTENFITKFARYYTPVVVGIAGGLAVLPPLLMADAAFSDWLYRALVFLVISCPCALVISIPLGFFGGIGGASRKGILIKGSNFLEALNSVETVVFDKTGTLTKGVFKVTEIHPAGEYTKDQVLEWAAYAESFSNHPIALSVLKAYGGTDKEKVESYQEIPGQGIRARISGSEVLAGNSRLLDSQGVKHPPTDSLGTVIHVARDGSYLGAIVIADEVKEDSAMAIKALKDLGVKKTVMLTGDAKVVGEAIGSTLQLDEVYTQLLPTDKVEKLELLDRQNSAKGKIVFVGDGLNDAPVLARADIGIAMGGVGSDAAIEAADIVIMNDEPMKIPTAIKIAKRTRGIVWQNILLAMGVKIVFLALGALGIASLWEAVFADVGVALLAVFNATRVLKVKND